MNFDNRVMNKPLMPYFFVILMLLCPIAQTNTIHKQVSPSASTKNLEFPKIGFFTNDKIFIQWIEQGTAYSYGIILDMNGNIAKDVYQLFTLGSFSSPTIASIENGQILLFGVYGSLKSKVDIYTFDDAGTKTYSKYDINSFTLSSISDTFAGTFPTNDCILGWKQSGDIKISYLDKIEIGLTATELTITDSSTSSNEKGQIVILQDKSFVVTWQGVDSITGKNIYAKHYKHDRNVQKNQFMVNLQANGDQLTPTIGIFSDGTYIIAWQSDDTTSGIHALKFDSNSQRIGTQETILIQETTLLDYEMKPQIAILSDDTFLLTWQKKESSKFHLYMQKFDKNMIKIGLESKINEDGSFNEINSHIIGTKQGKYALVYDHKNSSTELSKIYTTSEPPNSYYYSNGTQISSCNTTSGEFLQEQFGTNTYICKHKCENIIDGYLYPNDSCQSGCLLPMIQTISGVIKTCSSPCIQSEWYWSQNASCVSSCEQPLTTNQLSYYKECITPCSTSKPFYYSHNETCQEECLQPYSIQSQELIQICNHPCGENHLQFYLPHNTTCQEKCPDPFKNSEQNGVKYCQNQCQNHNECDYEAFPICIDNLNVSNPNQPEKLCSSCSTDSQCNSKFGFDKKYCNQNLGECQFCKTNLDCTTTSISRCQTYTGTCEACQTDKDCSHLNNEIHDFTCKISQKNIKSCQPELTVDQRAAKVIGTASTTLSATATVASIALSSNPVILYFLTSFLQKFYYLLLLNIDFPDFLRTFFKSFSFTRLSFLVVIFEDVKESQSTEVYPNFEKMGFHGSYLINTGGVIVALVLIMGILYFIKIFVRWCQFLKVLNKYDKVYKIIFWDGIFIFIGLFAMEFIVTSFLQLVTFEANGIISFVSQGLALGTIIGMIIFIKYSFSNVKYFFRDQKMKKYETQIKPKRRKTKHKRRRNGTLKNPKKSKSLKDGKDFNNDQYEVGDEQRKGRSSSEGLNIAVIPNSRNRLDSHHNLMISTKKSSSNHLENFDMQMRPHLVSTQLSIESPLKKSSEEQVPTIVLDTQQNNVMQNETNRQTQNYIIEESHSPEESQTRQNYPNEHIKENEGSDKSDDSDKLSYTITDPPKRPTPKRYENAFLVNKKALKEAYKEDRGKSANWFLRNKIPVTIAIRFIAGMAFPTFYFSVEVQLFFEFVCELMLGAMIILCWKFTETMTSLMELLHSLTMFALLQVMALMSQKDLDKEQRDRYARVVIFIGTASLGLTIMLMIPNMIKDLKIKLKNSCKKRKNIADQSQKLRRKRKSKRMQGVKLKEKN